MDDKYEEFKKWLKNFEMDIYFQDIYGNKFDCSIFDEFEEEFKKNEEEFKKKEREIKIKKKILDDFKKAMELIEKTKA